MEATSISQLLKGFCDHSQWKYAVFWKLDHHFPMTLTWENGYQKRDEVEESMWGDINFKSPYELCFSSGESTDCSGDFSARFLMIEMSHKIYSVGEGVVGKIALARDHFWVSWEDILTSKFDTDLIPECPDEWLLQFASGIKTIVLIPVLPLGVLQFGSYQVVAEDLDFVTNVREKFHSIQHLEENITPLNLGTDYQEWEFSDLVHNLMDSLDESSSVTKSILKSEVSTSTVALNSNSSRLNPETLSIIRDDSCLSKESIIKSLKRANENEIASTSIVMSTVPRHISKVETKSNHMEEEIWSWSHLINNVGVFGEKSNGLQSLSVNSVTENQYGGTETDHDDVKKVNDFTFPSECELYKALGSVTYRETGKSMSNCISFEETYSNSTLVTNKREYDHIKGLEFPKDFDPEYLLDAVVGNLCSAADDTSSISDSVRSLPTMPTKYAGSILPKNNLEESTLIVDYSDVKNDLIPAVMIKGKDEFSPHFTSSFDGNASLLIDEVRQEKANSHMNAISGPKLSSTSKKRTRISNNQKSRPRDRQLIMDRMKELRELVPDGGRCSIDNLLERTIKHMLYLRKITSQVEKLKRFSNRVPQCKRQKVNGSHPGRSCAFDFESELSWPIVIEDLECSGHMLIEMICNDYGLFLEIAQVIRKLDVTILKGILENHSSNSWACFIVEVPRGFHRMDVLCPLLHLLQLRRNAVSYKS